MTTKVSVKKLVPDYHIDAISHSPEFSQTLTHNTRKAQKAFPLFEPSTYTR
ncbi:MAG: hypothetical protein HYR68_01945 [Burkholderiales bacterium]|nr:hypothetical protein [Burkholderiales bacterium]